MQLVEQLRTSQWLFVLATDDVLPPTGLLRTLDYLHCEAVTQAYRQAFWQGKRGETLLLPATDHPWQGCLFLGCGSYDGVTGFQEAIGNASRWLPKGVKRAGVAVCTRPKSSVDNWAEWGERNLKWSFRNNWATIETWQWIGGSL